MGTTLTSPILWAEDDENDVVLFYRALKKAQFAGTVMRVRDGEEVIQYLNGQGCYADRSKYPLPSLLLLDIKMPTKSGFDVLLWKNSQPKLRDVPTVILSSSNLDCDRQTAHALGACAYLMKATSSEQMSLIVQSLNTVRS